ncbi:MAG: division/cell wall cluster transcriptional repressor MraZ [Nitrospirae bacterium]|nr:division/cell wall cluster transcriptional repressor MraZ [Nitrospirota bacterium]
MGRFRGSFTHAIDSKGRLSIPAKFRAVLSDGHGSEKLFLTCNGACIEAYPLAVWEDKEDRMDERMRQAPLGDAEASRVIMRHNFHAQECEVDRLGRILVSKDLRDRAGLTSDVVIVGMVSHFAIWDRGRIESAAQGEAQG